MFLVVLVIAFTVFENPIGIGQTGIAELRSKAQGVARLGIVHAGVDTVVVNKTETIVAQIANVVCIRVYEGRLRQTKHIGRGDVAICIALGPTVVAKVVGIAHIGHVKFSRETLEEVHIGVEADVQTIERVVFGRGLCVGISQREVVHGHVVTTLYADTIVLRNGSAVKILGPVRIVVELLVVKVGGIFVEEGDDHRRGKTVSSRRGAEELSKVVSILTGVHHAGTLGRKFHTAESTDVDASGLRMSALGRDFQYAVSSLRTIEGGTVAKDFYTFDVFGIDEVEDIVIETVVQRGATVLHVPNDSVDNDKRLCIGVERVDAIDEHGCTLGRKSTTIDGTDRGIEVVLDISFGRNTAGFDRGILRFVENGGAVVIEREEFAVVEIGIGGDTVVKSYLNGIVSVGGDEKRGDVFGYAELVGAFFVGECRIKFIAERLYANTGERLARSGIINHTGDFLHLVLRKLTTRRYLIGGGSGGGAVGYFAGLRLKCTGRRQNHQRHSTTKGGLLHVVAAISWIHNLVCYISAGISCRDRV